MLATAVDRLPVGESMLYEPKWDGFRCLAETGPVRMTSRNGKPLNHRFPEVAVALEGLPDGVLLDGEIIRWADDGRLDFGALLERNAASARHARTLARSHPCHLVVFDLLTVGVRDIAHRALAHRRAELELLMRDIVRPSPVTLGWQTDNPEVAMQWWAEMPSVGVEGVVIKDARRSYRPGRRGWRKYKHRVTTEAIVGGVIGRADAPRSLILGRVESGSGELRIAGHSTELGSEQSEEIAEHLVKTDDHPWPRTLAPGWGESDRRRYTQVVPEVVVEVAPDSAVISGRWRHAVRYLRLRTDMTPRDVPVGLDTE